MSILCILPNTVEFSLSIISDDLSMLYALCNNNLGQKGFCSTKVPDTSLQAWSRKDKVRIGQLITLYIVINIIGIWDLSKLCVGELTRKYCLKKINNLFNVYCLDFSFFKNYILLASYLSWKGSINTNASDYCIHLKKQTFFLQNFNHIVFHYFFLP